MKNLFILSILCFGAVSAKAQIPQPDPDTTAKHFLIVASIKNLQEISAGELALKMAKRPEVKTFGQMMVTDHQAAEQLLLQTAKESGISLLPAATGGIQPDLMLKNAGAAFDKMYVHAMVSGHRNTVEVFQNYATTGKNAAVRDLARQLLPKLKHHLEEIEQIEQKL
ncbi:DUF4142 domain-containing protein [Mucilaginibacter ginsenosidivorax]|uniref:DUF4142 domain-containing protein n=1 Tax=Mucilaginibacter ginsenosidivorax TaxID=862126 RepID=A0A5B8VU34_9SPHI|nr:DUF4142 domain-containing protein [Mucilaginibacter ginsenosidivorax]QEC74753.1 DUF4142 domain-containing protein [Mucilaginibacter ginsenosidivorax]